MKTIQEILKFRSKLFAFYEVTRESALNQKQGHFDVLKTLDWVNIVAIDKNQEVVLVKQFRQGIAEMTIEIPGGAVDRGESFEAAAKRELREETGYTSDEWKFLGEVTPNPAFMSNRCQTYLALNCEQTKPQDLDPFEEIEVLTLSQTAVKEHIQHQKIDHALVLSAFYYYFASK